MAEATFAAGCFWGIEAAFAELDGVTATSVGYTGGQAENPTYEQVCSGMTGHAEAVRVDYDPDKVSYDDLLALFWETHDPTTLNRQGPDVGSQYRSAIFVHDAEQEAAAREMKRRLDEAGHFGRPIVTEISPAAAYWLAEDYHQKYDQKRHQSGGDFLARLLGRG